jgi:hypothetical protein
MFVRTVTEVQTKSSMRIKCSEPLLLHFVYRVNDRILSLLMEVEIMTDKRKTGESSPNSPGNSRRKFAQDLPGASQGSRQRWRSMINGGSPEQPDKDGTARHDRTPELPARPTK